MKYVLYGLCAVLAYLLSSFNPAIALSRAVYHTDIRTQGSGNPGFTNFRRVFGARYAWVVFLLDIGKGLAALSVAGLLFRHFGDGWQAGVAYGAAFALVGHAFPAQYGFRGGKGFLVCLSAAWLLDWRAGLAATLVMVGLLLTTRYMSLSTMAGLIVGAGCVAALGAALPVCVAYAACVAFVVVRHRENIRRLLHGNETKFRFGHS